MANFETAKHFGIQYKVWYNNMAVFYGTVQGNNGKAHRCGTKASGIETVAATKRGAVRVSVFVDYALKKEGEIRYVVDLIPWLGSGETKELTSGVIE